MKTLKQLMRRPEVWLLVLMTAIGIFLRFWRLGQPTDYVFDEVYYAKWAQSYLHSVSFFDVHPPLGKLLIAVSEFFVGNTGYGWRFIEALLGSTFVPLSYFVALKIFKSGRVALFTAYFVLLDGLLLVQSRTALLDSPLVAFSLGAYACFLMWRETEDDTANYWLLGSGILLGLGIATKWTAVAPLGTILLFVGAHELNKRRTSPIWAIISLIIIPATIYLASFTFNQIASMSFWQYLIDWHHQAWNFQHTLRAPHPYMSRWWTWLYLQRPVWYYYQQSGNLITGIDAIGNPVLWWASIPALLMTIIALVKKPRPELLLPLVAFLAAYAPWWFIGRTQFQYYIVGGVPFMFMLLAYWLDQLLKKRFGHEFVVLIMGLALAAAVFFLPLWIGYPITYHGYELHMWFKSWI